jgi:hypothetical protein
MTSTWSSGFSTRSPAGPPQRPEGGRDLRLGDHRNRGKSTGLRAAGDARDQAGIGSNSGATSPPADSPRHAWSWLMARPGCPRRSRRSGRGRTVSTAPFTASETSRPSSPKSEHDRIRFNYWSALTDGDLGQGTESSASGS